MPDKQYKVDLNMTGNKVTNVADGSAPGDAVNLSQLQSAARGQTWKDAVRAASTTNITVSSPGASIDGVTLSNGDRVLLKNQSAPAENGIYQFNGSSSALTRTLDANSSTTLKAGTAVLVTEGTQNQDKSWIVTTDGTIVVGTTAVTWAQTGGGNTYTAGNGLALTGTTFSVLPNGTSIDVTSSGVKIADAAAGDGLGIASGVLSVNTSTGLTKAADAVQIDTSLTARWKSATAGNGSSTSLTLNHNLGNAFHLASAQDAATGEEWICGVTKGSNSTTFTFSTAPATNSVVLVVVG